ncbi:DUF4232 domain-containing protein [Brachybacterium paraconglomeratum]|uniref:DUF4232 domain-containing protein n=1 Tax=Brachybacterium paraconglomeratum TaxID=173362 RepID=UPI0031F0E606
MSRTPAPRRARDVRRADGLRSPAVGVLAAALVFAGIVVLLVVGIWASRLGDSPSWAFDCNDTTCTDLWADARGHYLRVAAGAGLTTLLGAALWSVALPPRAVPLREGPRRALLRLITPMLLAAVALWSAFWLALAVSRPIGLAVVLLALLLATLTTWRWQRPGAESDRTAYLSAGLGVMAPALVGGVLALHPLGLLAAVLLFGHPWLGVVVLAVVLLAGSILMGRLLPRTEDVPRADAAVQTPATGSLPDTALHPAGTDTAAAEDAAAGNGTAASPRRRVNVLLTYAALAAILTVAVLAARPVDAPAADAWKYAGASGSEARNDAGTGAGDDRAPSEPGPAGTGTAAPTTAPEIEAAGLPPCRPQSLQLVAEGWDGITGNSVATLRATNIGATSCALRGMPELMLTQGGEEIELRPEPLAHLEPAVEMADGIGLAPGSSARSRLYWPGYRTAADQETPQTLTVRTDPAEVPMTVTFLPTSYGDDPGPAPFDLKAGVEGGAVIEIGAWEAAPSSGG